MTTLGPRFHVRQRVLAVDSTTQQQQQLRGSLCGDDHSNNTDGPPPTESIMSTISPLYEAIVLQSSMKFVDAESGDIILRGESEEDEREWCYYIHFQGWHKRHDTWMREHELFVDTPDNRTRVGNKNIKTSKQLHHEGGETNDYVEKKKSTKRARALTEVNNNDGNDQEDLCTLDNIRSIYSDNLQLITRASLLPFTLQTILVDDRDMITGSDNSMEVVERKAITMLHIIPVNKNIVNVISDYIRYGKKQDLIAYTKKLELQRGLERLKAASSKVDDTITKNNKLLATTTITEESTTKSILKLKKKRRKKFAQSIIALVDLCLPLFLLYNEERQQYAQIVAEEGRHDHARSDASSNKNDNSVDMSNDQGRESMRNRPSEMYGAEHLLRLFVKLPFILSQYDGKDATVDLTLENSHEGNVLTDSYILASKELSREFAEHLLDLVRYLQRNLDCFTGQYMHALRTDL